MDKTKLSTNPADYSDDPADLLLPASWEEENVCENKEYEDVWQTNPFVNHTLN